MRNVLQTPSQCIAQTAWTRRRFLKRISQGTGAVGIGTLWWFDRAATAAQPSCHNDSPSDAIFFEALMRCSLNVERFEDTPILVASFGDETALCQALRCLADVMKSQGFVSACAHFEETTVRWGWGKVFTENSREIAIATSDPTSVRVVASGGHALCSVYASGANDDSVSADACAVGPNSHAIACGGHAPPASGGNGGHASASAPGNTLAQGGNASQGGRGGKATATSLGARGGAVAWGGQGGAHLTSSGGQGGSADALTRNGTAQALGGEGGEANLAGNGGNGGTARADGGNGPAEAQGGNGGHVSECCGNGGHGGQAEAHSTGDAATARGGSGGIGRGQGRRGGNGGNVRAIGNLSLISPGAAGAGEEQAVAGQTGREFS